MLPPSVDQDLLHFPQGLAHFTHTCKRVHPGHIRAHTHTHANSCTGSIMAAKGTASFFAKSGSGGFLQRGATCISVAQPGLRARQGQERAGQCLPGFAEARPGPCALCPPRSCVQSLVAGAHSLPRNQPDLGRARRPTRRPASTETQQRSVCLSLFRKSKESNKGSGRINICREKVSLGGEEAQRVNRRGVRTVEAGPGWPSAPRSPPPRGPGP